jgi:FKBP-type peptidyl-prolyl cis-trans isomerase
MIRCLLASLLLAVATVAYADPPPEISSVIQWHTTPSGLQYAELAVGKGPTPHEGQVIILHFAGWMDDGTQFEDTRKRGRAFGFPLGSGQVIKGMDEAVRTMRAGGKRRLVVPSQLAYGEKGVPGLVPPNAKLTFDIELLRISDEPMPTPYLPPPVTPQPNRRP